jgi:hypothetical protein
MMAGKRTAALPCSSRIRPTFRIAMGPFPCCGSRAGPRLEEGVELHTGARVPPAFEQNKDLYAGVAHAPH